MFIVIIPNKGIKTSNVFVLLNEETLDVDKETSRKITGAQ